MGKKIYLAILSVITVVCVLFGLFINLGRVFSFKTNNVTEIRAESEEGTVDPFKSIDLDVDLGDISIKYGDDYYVYSQFMSNRTTTWEVKDGVLHVNNNAAGFDFGNSAKNKYKIEITVPEGTNLEKVKVKMDMGNCEIYDISMEKLTADLDMGNFETHDTFAKAADIKCDMGNVEYLGNAEEIRCDCNMGNVSVNVENEKDVKFDLSADLGSVSVNGKGYNNKYSN